MDLLKKSLSNAINNILRNKLINFLCLGIISFTLLTLGIFNYISYNLEIFTHNFSKNIEAIFYFKNDVKEKEIYNITPLHLASHGNNGGFFEALSSRIEIAKTLVKYDAPINDVDGDGQTPLHYAVEYNHPELIKLFLKNGADPTIKDTYDLVPSDYTKEKPVIAMLKKYSKDFQK